MLVFELPLKICVLSPLPYLQAAEKIGRFIKSALDEPVLGLGPGYPRAFLPYTFDFPFPLEAEHIYHAQRVYTIRIRTIVQELAEFFVRRLPLYVNGEIQGLSGELRVIPQCMLEKVYTLTPVVMKTKQGYWRNQMQISEYEERLKNNLIDKYYLWGRRELWEKGLSAGFSLSGEISFMNRKPVRIPYKNIALLGDKLSLTVPREEFAQELLYMALGTGMGENNTGGCGFLGYRFR